MLQGKKTHFTKRLFWGLLFLMSMGLVLGACGKEKETVQQQGSWRAQYEGLVFGEGDPYLTLGVQYYDRKIVKLAADRENNVFLYREGETVGSKLMENTPQDYLGVSAHWWLDTGRQIYVMLDEYLMLLTETGGEQYRIKLPGNAAALCRDGDGKLWAVLQHSERFVSGIVQIDEESQTAGEVKWLEEVVYGIASAGEKGILLIGAEGISIYQKEPEYLLHWTNAEYAVTGQIAGARYLSDKQVEILTPERTVLLTYTENTETEKIILTYKTTGICAPVQECIAQFNKENERYYVQTVICPDEESPYAFRDKVQVEIAAGIGPDILDYLSVQSIMALQEKGALEELSPYLENSNLEMEDYFPICSEPDQNGNIYGLIYGASPTTLYMRQELVGTGQGFCLESLLENLENYEGELCLFDGQDVVSILKICLAYSQDLGGMLDMEAGKCNFTDGRLARMLELAARYRCVHRENSIEPSLSGMGVLFNFTELCTYVAVEKVTAQAGMVMTGYPTTNGGVNGGGEKTLYMNAQSAHKEGVWEFMEYMLSKECQLMIGRKSVFVSALPVLKEAFLESQGEYVGQLSYPGGFVKFEGVEWEEVTEEELQAFYEMMETMELYSEYTLVIREIIFEEAESYFDGDRSVEEVCELIQNRVQLYLDEHEGGLQKQ